MKRISRIIVGMLLLAIPMCMNAQVNPSKGESTKPGTKPKTEKAEVEKAKTEKAVKPEKKEKNVKTEKSLKPSKSEKAETTLKPTKSEKEEKTITAKKTAKADEAENPEKTEKKSGGLEMPKISGFVQGMYQANFDEDFNLSSNTFRMRRVRLSVDGTLYKGLTYKIQGDFSRSPMLVDAYVKYKACNAFAIQIGQFKTPFTLESPINPVNLEIFDYGESVQKLVGYSDVCGVGALGRDLGVMATGSLFPVKDYRIVDYAIGVFNGNGANALDNNNRKDIVGRLEVHPGLKDLTLSGSFYYGQYKSSDNEGVRNRWTAGAQYNDGNLIVRAEYLSGTTGYNNGNTYPNGEIIELYRSSAGYYAVAGYNIAFGKDKSQKLMPVLRYEHFEPGDMNDIVYGGTNWYTAGINYWPLKSLNFKLDYSLVQQTIGEKTNSHRVVGILSYKF